MPVQFFAVQPVHQRGAFGPGCDHAALSQYLEVVRQCGLGQIEVEAATGHLPALRQLSHNGQPDRIAKSGQYLVQLLLGVATRWRMGARLRASSRLGFCVDRCLRAMLARIHGTMLTHSCGNMNENPQARERQCSMR